MSDQILDETIEQVSQWRTLAVEHELPEHFIQEVERGLRLDLLSLVNAFISVALKTISRISLTSCQISVECTALVSKYSVVLHFVATLFVINSVLLL